MDQTPSPSSFSPQNFQKIEKNDEHQKLTKMDMAISVRTVSSRGTWISYYYILKVPKSLESTHLGFVFILSIQDFSLLSSLFHKPQAYSWPTQHALPNAHELAANYEIRKNLKPGNGSVMVRSLSFDSSKQLLNNDEEARCEAQVRSMLLLMLKIQFHHGWHLKMQLRFHAPLPPNHQNSLRGWLCEFKPKRISNFGVELMENFGNEGFCVLEGLERMWWFQIWFLKIVNSVMIRRWFRIYMVA